MCILVNKEIAIIGLFSAITDTVIKYNSECNSTQYRLENIYITPADIIEYTYLLSYADCGPIIRNFNSDSLISLFENEKSLFKKHPSIYGSYALCTDKMYYTTAHEYYKEELLALLFKMLSPSINYPRKFLEYMNIL